jgi:hypothetical protein
MYLLFIWGWTYGFEWGGNPFLGTFERVGPEISTFLGTNGTRVPLVMDYSSPSKSIRPAPSKTTGTLIVITNHLNKPKANWQKRKKEVGKLHDNLSG